MPKRTTNQSQPLFDENNFSYVLSDIAYEMTNGELVIDNCSYERNHPIDPVYEVAIQYARLRHVLLRAKNPIIRE